MDIDETNNNFQKNNQNPNIDTIIFSKYNSQGSSTFVNDKMASIHSDIEKVNSNIETSKKNSISQSESHKNSGSLSIFGDSKELFLKNDSKESVNKNIFTKMKDTFRRKSKKNKLQVTNSNTNLNSQSYIPKLVNIHDKIKNSYCEKNLIKTNSLINSRISTLEYSLEKKNKQLIRWKIATIFLLLISIVLFGVLLFNIIYFIKN
uniref:V-SNARE coiled-coil homology domain-containing protein n=1 Tax=Strongyloides stercoralis TaxID=6248 RepID=A0A0K0E5R9_STRER